MSITKETKAAVSGLLLPLAWIIRSLLSFPIKICIKLLVVFLVPLEVDQSRPNKGERTLYLEKRFAKKKLRLLELLMYFHSKIRKIYETLSGLGALALVEPGATAYGLETSGQATNFQLFGPPKPPDGSRGFNVYWLNDFKRTGKFVIRSVDDSNGGSYVIKAIWISGPHAGEGFVLEKPRSFDSLKKVHSNDKIPSYFFLEPKWLRGVMVVAALLGLIKFGLEFFGLVKPFLPSK